MDREKLLAIRHKLMFQHGYSVEQALIELIDLLEEEANA